MDIDSDKKDAVIGVLTGLCFVLFFTLFGNIFTPDCSSTPAPVAQRQANKDGKLAAIDVIKQATIYGVSLDTPVDQIDGLLGEIPFDCRSNEQKDRNEEEQVINSQKFWRCNHKTFKRTSMRVTAVDGKITKVYRDGLATKEEIKTVIANLDLLKAKLASLKDFSINQSERSTVFKLGHTNEGKTKSSISYRMQFVTVRDPENPPEHDGVLNVALIR